MRSVCAALAALLLLQCATAPPRAPVIRHEPPPRKFYTLPLDLELAITDRRAEKIWFEVPPNRDVVLWFDLPPGFSCRYDLSRDGQDTADFDYLSRDRSTRLSLEPGQYELVIDTTEDRAQTIRLRVHAETRDGAPVAPEPEVLPPVIPPPSPPGIDEPPRPKCPRAPADAGEIRLGKSVSAFFGTKGTSASRWYAFSLAKRARVEAAVTVRNPHPVRLFIADASGCTIKSSENLSKSGTIAATLTAGRYYVRVYTNTKRRRNVHFTIALREPRATEVPPPPPPPSPPPPPPLSPELECSNLQVPSAGVWVVIVDPIAPNDPPQKLDLVLTTAAGARMSAISSPPRQPCLLTREYQLSAGSYRACAMTKDLQYRPDVLIRMYSAATAAPNAKIIRDCE